jgi:hypothetical protein
MLLWDCYFSRGVRKNKMIVNGWIDNKASISNQRVRSRMLKSKRKELRKKRKRVNFRAQWKQEVLD